MSAVNTYPSKQEEHKAKASAWFAELRDKLCAAFEAIEDANPVTAAQKHKPGRFVKKSWRRGEGKSDEGGGEMALLQGQVFEKLGVHVSTVHGEFSHDFAREMGLENERDFWAAGISVIAHPRNPRAPAAHMNTRYIITTKDWFGGGADLTPMLTVARNPDHPDTIAFHAALKKTCDAHDGAYYENFKSQCDKYFYLPHRHETRGTGGIFFDHHNSGDWDRDFAFTRDVGLTFLDIYPQIMAKRMAENFTAAEREEQLICRGRYAEFNLLYDRGTRFGLQTGGNVEAILSSLPPEVKWP